jgi:predicted helicase
MIQFYNAEVDRFTTAYPGLSRLDREALLGNFLNFDPKQISWNRSLKQDFTRGRKFEFIAEDLVPSLYRPFAMEWVYFNRDLNAYVNQLPKMFPNVQSTNLVIGVSASESRSGFSVLISNRLPCLHATDMIGSQFFPLYLYDIPASEDSAQADQAQLFNLSSRQTLTRRDAITAEGLEHFQSAYPGESIDREDIFYYVYGLLHSPDYRERFADNLGKELPRIPFVKTAADFWAFSQAGRKLADLHLNYERVEPYPLKIDSGGKKLTDPDYRVEKMRYGKKGKDKDLTTLHYNDRITLTGIPLEAYDYVVNGKPALDWVVERQSVKIDKDSGIVNDANDWAVETMGNPRYPLELFQRVVTVSLETMKIVRSLPQLDIASPNS